VGDKVQKGEPLVEIHANDEDKLAEARKALLVAHQIVAEIVPPLPLFYE